VTLLESDDVARGLVWGAVVVSIGAELVATYVGRAGRGPATTTRSLDRGTKQVILAATVAGLAAAWLIGRSGGPGSDSWPVLAAGAVLILLGGALRTWGVATLGRFFRRTITVQEGQTIVRQGPYRLIRHPAYLGTIVAVSGLGLALGGWLGALAAAAITLAGHVPRIRAEEAMLTDAFGETYREYARATARLVPGVW